MTSDIVHRNGDALSGVASLFFETVKEEQDQPELNNDYPYAHIVELDGRTFIGFETDLPQSREPWDVRGLTFTRDMVFEDQNVAAMDTVGGDMKSAVNALIAELA